jgi:hypothetical protein
VESAPRGFFAWIFPLISAFKKITNVFKTNKGDYTLISFRNPFLLLDPIGNKVTVTCAAASEGFLGKKSPEVTVTCYHR